MLRAVDLFAGGGGLTLGLKAAKFEVVAGVEWDEHACATYRANHPEVHLLERDIRTVSGEELRTLAGNQGIDLLAGCPPCQGYTSLNKRTDDDPRNALILEMSRLAKELAPKAIMMENVPGLTTKGKSLFDQLKTELKDLGYKFATSTGVLDAVDFGVPQRRRRLVLLAGLGFEIKFPQRTHSRDGTDGLKPWKSVKDAIRPSTAMGEPLVLPRVKLRYDMRKSYWHIVRELSPQNVARIKEAVPGESWSRIPESLRPNCHQGEYRGFTNVYGRMRWDQPSPTITAGCTTLSKGRFGHPESNRTISVREAALLQTFPIGYRFVVPHMDQVCNVIGNALPCDFAEVLAIQCRDALRANPAEPGLTEHENPVVC